MPEPKKYGEVIKHIRTRKETHKRIRTKAARLNMTILELMDELSKCKCVKAKK